MKAVLLFAIASILPQAAFAQKPAEPADLLTLRSSWTKARQQALAPIDQKYLNALEALKLKYTRAGQLPEAVAIDAEIRSLATADVKSMPAAPAASAPVAAEAKKLTRTVLCATPWTYHIPQEGRSWTYEFTADRKVLVDNVLFGVWTITSSALRVENADGRLWQESPLDLKVGAQGKLYLEEADSSKGMRKGVTLTQH